MPSQRLAIDDSRPGPEISRQGPQIQPVIPLPRSSRNDAGAVGAYVFRKGLLRRMANIETAEIYPYGQRGPIFQPARNRLHETPRVLRHTGRMGAGVGTTVLSYAGWGRKRTL